MHTLLLDFHYNYFKIFCIFNLNYLCKKNFTKWYTGSNSSYRYLDMISFSQKQIPRKSLGSFLHQKVIQILHIRNIHTICVSGLHIFAAYKRLRNLHVYKLKWTETKIAADCMSYRRIYCCVYMSVSLAVCEINQRSKLVDNVLLCRVFQRDQTEQGCKTVRNNVLCSKNSTLTNSDPAQRFRVSDSIKLIICVISILLLIIFSICSTIFWI